MGDHSKLSPSSRHRWAHCPGSVRESAKYPVPPSGTAAIDGTHSHTLLEHCINNRIHDPAMLTGVTLTDHEGSFKVTTARAARVKVAIDYIYFRLGCLNGMASIKSETKVSPKYLTKRNDLDGTVDCIIAGSGVLEIIDYKDGRTPVPAENNEQLEQYAIGVLSGLNLPISKWKEYPYQEIRMTIVQPRLQANGQSAVSTFTFPIKELKERAARLKDQAKATDDPNAPLVPGESQCQYCPAKNDCPAALAAKAAVADNRSLGEMGIVFPIIVQK